MNLFFQTIKGEYTTNGFTVLDFRIEKTFKFFSKVLFPVGEPRIFFVEILKLHNLIKI